MSLNALLVSRQPQSLRVLTAALEELEIEHQLCASADDGMERLVRGYFSALVLDFDLPGAAQVARLARLAPAQHRPVVFAMIGALTDIASTFQSGANFVLYKPLALEQVRRSLRAGRGFMRPDRRRAPRHNVETMVYLRYGEESVVPALVLDLSEEGLAVQAIEPLPAVQKVPLHFVLPGTSDLVAGRGEVIWADDSGRAGLFLAQLTPASRKLLKSWLAKRSGRKSPARATPRAQKPRASVSPAH